MDVFYIEKWCLILDIKIIFYTILNGISGEEKGIFISQ
jgi:putative colanic acid biosynthesis UDP-glucose lipid carrier transferase